MDANVFAHKAWIGPIIESARAGVIQPIWSPCIIAEASRLLAWIFVKKNPEGLGSNEWRRRFSEKAKKWFAWASPYFVVVEDRGPYEPQWTSEPPDPWDQPIWTAAIRGRAQIVVTEDLDDGPPRNATGRRRYRGIDYVHPNTFLLLLDAWGDAQLSQHLVLLEGAEEPTIVASNEPSVSESIEVPEAFWGVLSKVLESQ